MKYSCFGSNYEVRIVKDRYKNGRTALTLIDENGEPFATASVNLPDTKLNPGEILIKTWSENEGMLDFLVANNIVEDTGREVPTGYVTARVCKLLI